MVVAWAMYGANADATILAARETLMKMPEQGRSWLLSAIDQLDAPTAVWVTGRLAAITKANTPR